MRISEVILLAALAAVSHATYADTTVETKVDAEIKVEETHYSTDPYTGDVVACNDTGCEIVSTGTNNASVDDHFKLANAAVGPNEVVVCGDDGCFVTDARSVDPNKVSTVCDDDQCVLVPDGHDDPDFCRADGVCYSCGINAAHIAEAHNIDMNSEKAPDYSELSFSERLKMMCADEGKNGLSAMESGGVQSGWQPSSAPSTNYQAQRLPPRRPQSFEAPTDYSRPTTRYEAPTQYSSKPAISYQATNYSTTSGSKTRDLSKGQFDEQVAQFDSQNEVFNQQTYEVRIDAEADMMIALEALKNEVNELASSLSSLEYKINHQTHDIELNTVVLYENNSKISENSVAVDNTLSKVHNLQDECRHVDWALHENRNTLTLYCQQFAFAPEMVWQCKDVLSCRDRQVHYRFAFQGHPTSSDQHY